MATFHPKTIRGKTYTLERGSDHSRGRRKQQKSQQQPQGSWVEVQRTEP
jgi:hypothetical protein